MKVSILGSGSFATAIAQILTDNGNEVLLFTNDLEQIDEINIKKTNKKYYKDFLFDSCVRATASIHETLKFSNIIVIALPSHIISKILENLNKIITEEKIFINMSKGIDYKNLTTISEIIENKVDKRYINHIYSLTGPSFANEVIERKITKLMLASENMSSSKKIISLFENDYIKIDKTTDIIGIELLSSIKNVIALASGILYGLGYKENTHAYLITLGIKEMQKIAPFYDIETSTIYSVSGLGDLLLTSSSKTSRNFITGFKVGEGKSIKKAVESTKTIVEGIECSKSLYKFSKLHKIKLPICSAVYNIFYKEKKAKDEILKIFQ